jgi:hypothetical protein
MELKIDQTASELRPGYRVSLATSPSSAPADGASSIAVTATVTDSGGNPMTGAPVQFAASGSANDLISVSQGVTIPALQDRAFMVD